MNTSNTKDEPKSLLFSVQGFSPHISPFVQLRDLGGLLNGAGYSLTTIVSQPFTPHISIFVDLIAL